MRHDDHQPRAVSAPGDGSAQPTAKLPVLPWRSRHATAGRSRFRSSTLARLEVVRPASEHSCVDIGVVRSETTQIVKALARAYWSRSKIAERSGLSASTRSAGSGGRSISGRTGLTRSRSQATRHPALARLPTLVRLPHRGPPAPLRPHRSVQALEKDIREWVAAWNENPKPFIWVKTAEQILQSISRFSNDLTAQDTSGGRDGCRGVIGAGFRRRPCRRATPS